MWVVYVGQKKFEQKPEISWLKELLLPEDKEEEEGLDLALAVVARVASKASTDQMRFLFQRYLEGREPGQSNAGVPWWMALGG